MPSTTLPARDQFLDLFRESLREGAFIKLTLGKPAGPDPALQNLYVRPVQLKAGRRLACVWRYATRDVTKNLTESEALALLEPMIGSDFLDGHLFTAQRVAQLEGAEGAGRLRVSANPQKQVPPAAAAHDRQKVRLIPRDTGWLRALGVTDERGRPRPGMADKFRQIEKFAELLSHLVPSAPLAADRPLQVYDMGCGKGYLTFAVSAFLGDRAQVCGVEARADLVSLCTQVAQAEGLSRRLSFRHGTIADTPSAAVDILIALHACDTATDDALARGVAAQAALLVVAPCCQKELRPALRPPPVLAAALRHGIFQERQAEFVTDALRAQLLEWAGYETKVLEFISSEHTAKNTMIAAIRTGTAADPNKAATIRDFAAFYGIRQQALATHLGFSLA